MVRPPYTNDRISSLTPPVRELAGLDQIPVNPPMLPSHLGTLGNRSGTVSRPVPSEKRGLISALDLHCPIAVAVMNDRQQLVTNVLLAQTSRPG
ncbi:uncharacterized protein BDW70DRAFT_137770 [Aspergillus foveolatus]|uniref:uncharacterized protein n=1 Tax=Aspergillus foveolatus TaxID=210207 RepID=UPI003CCD6408